MKTFTFWFDLASPEAQPAFAELPERLAGQSVRVRYRSLPRAQAEPWARQALACVAPGDDPSRWVTECLLQAHAAGDLASLAQRCPPRRDPQDDSVTQDWQALVAEAPREPTEAVGVILVEEAAAASEVPVLHLGLAGIAALGPLPPPSAFHPAATP